MSETYICKWEGCEYEPFTDIDIMYSHLTSEHVGRKTKGNLCLTCKWQSCGHSFTKRDHITSHVKIHIPYKPFPCQICNRPFKRAQDLKKHLKIHSEDSYTYQKSLKKGNKNVGIISDSDSKGLAEFNSNECSNIPSSIQSYSELNSQKGISPFQGSSSSNPQSPSPYSLSPATPGLYQTPDFVNKFNDYSPKKNVKRGLEDISESIKRMKSCHDQDVDVERAIAGAVTNLLMINPSDISELPNSMLNGNNLLELNQTVFGLFPEINDLNSQNSQNNSGNLFYSETSKDKPSGDSSIFDSLMEQIELTGLNTRCNHLTTKPGNTLLELHKFTDGGSNGASLSSNNASNNSYIPVIDSKTSISSLLPSKAFTSETDTLNSSSPHYNTGFLSEAQCPSFSGHHTSTTNSIPNNISALTSEDTTCNSTSVRNLDSVGFSEQNPSLPPQPGVPSSAQPPKSIGEFPGLNRYEVDFIRKGVIEDANMAGLKKSDPVVEAILENCIYTKLLIASAKLGIEFTPSQKERLRCYQLSFVKSLTFSESPSKFDSDHVRSGVNSFASTPTVNFLDSKPLNAVSCDPNQDNLLYSSYNSNSNANTRSQSSGKKDQGSADQPGYPCYSDGFTSLPASSNFPSNCVSSLTCLPVNDNSSVVNNTKVLGNLVPQTSGNMRSFTDNNSSSNTITDTFLPKDLPSSNGQAGRSPNEIANSMLEEIIELGTGYNLSKLSQNSSNFNNNTLQPFNFDKTDYGNGNDYLDNYGEYNNIDSDSINGFMPAMFDAGIVGSSINSRNSYANKHKKNHNYVPKVYDLISDSNVVSEDLYDSSSDLSDNGLLNPRHSSRTSRYSTSTNLFHNKDILRFGAQKFASNHKIPVIEHCPAPSNPSISSFSPSFYQSGLVSGTSGIDSFQPGSNVNNYGDSNLRSDRFERDLQNPSSIQSSEKEINPHEASAARSQAVKLISEILAKINLLYIVNKSDSSESGNLSHNLGNDSGADVGFDFGLNPESEKIKLELIKLVNKVRSEDRANLEHLNNSLNNSLQNTNLRGLNGNQGVLADRFNKLIV
ncbi:pH-response transcription factor pacC/RIM101 [Smittium mucronatum]|uniref:pH-response transcription factor pacC/RIM101 n=1 Tax=Smittium mucronatum TaxID=133383 RepID=A0A1R0GU58_9FUNG|nr:pH-response transcription factor pacC/RIM101 [Smittium mucronatum]